MGYESNHHLKGVHMKALVVDDDVVSRMALTDLLGSYDLFDLVEAADGEEAWKLMEQGLRPAICFCDVRMPRVSGIELLQRMKDNRSLEEVPFVLVSSASDRDTVLQAVRLGAVGYILKPLHAQDARAHIDKIFSVTLDKLAEHPHVTMRRLNIAQDRLLAYLNAFSVQLVSGSVDIAYLLRAGSGKEARSRIDAVHTGCMTLGLWQMAGRIDVLRGGVLDAARLVGALGEVAEAVQRQIRRTKSLDAPSGGTAVQRPGAMA